jgi:glycerol kinase
VIVAMESDRAAAMSELRADGGVTANNYLMQFQADILGKPVRRAKIAETTAMGAAILAGLAVGVWNSPRSERDDQGCRPIQTEHAIRRTRQTTDRVARRGLAHARKAIELNRGIKSNA